MKLAVAGLSQDVDLKLLLACNLLHAANVSIDLQPWTSDSCDLVALDLDDDYGRTVYAVALRKKLRILVFTRQVEVTGICTVVLSHTAPITTIARVLREMLVQPKPVPSGMHLPGLLGICHRLQGSDDGTVARSGYLAILLRPSAGRVYFKSHRDLYSAEMRSIDHSWSTSTVLRRSVDENLWVTSCSLESFLVRASHRYAANLPQLDQRPCRLKIWPDLGGLVDDLDALRLAAALRGSAWTISQLASQLGIEELRVNSFFVAMSAIGLLEGAQQTVEPAKFLEKSLVNSVVQRIARHFGMSMGQSHAEH